MTCMLVLKRCLSFGVPHNYGPLGHLQTTHRIWKEIVNPGDILVDATCGNGHDSLYLAKLLLSNGGAGRLYCIDIQKDAVDSTVRRLRSDTEIGSLVNDHICFVNTSHETFPSDISPESVALICYNLGYLPGKPRGTGTAVEGSGTAVQSLITKPHTTLASLQNALPLIRQGGLLSVVAYPGHEGGREETEAVDTFMRGLDEQEWRVYGNYPLNKPRLPVVFSAFKIDKRPKP